MGRILKRQVQESQYRGGPVNDVKKTSQSSTVLPETAAFFYINAGVPTADAGQAAGTAVFCTSVFDNIRNASGTMMGTERDTSILFTSTAFTNERMFPWEVAEAVDDVDMAARLAAITKEFKRGDYCVDYVTGIFYGIKASTQTALTNLTYQVRQEPANGTFVLPPTVDVTAVGGNAVDTDNGATTAGTLRVTISSDSTGEIKTLEQTGLVPKVYDYISLSYTGSNITTVVYKTGGAGGVTVATLTLGYTGSNLTSVTRT